MADDRAKKSAPREDPRITALRQKRAAAMAKAGPGMNPQQAGQFIRETIAELKKTTWPDRPTLNKSVRIVLAFIVATAVWVGVIDRVLIYLTAPLFGGSQ